MQSHVYSPSYFPFCISGYKTQADWHAYLLIGNDANTMQLQVITQQQNTSRSSQNLPFRMSFKEVLTTYNFKKKKGIFYLLYWKFLIPL